MDLKPSHSEYEGIYSRLESDDGYYIGDHRVIFGVRIRAGHKGRYWGPDLDWCCGDDDMLRIITRALLHNHMKLTPKGEDPFVDLPPYSKIKPIDRDDEFLTKVDKTIPGFKETIKAVNKRK